jgi:hypothetical protein
LPDENAFDVLPRIKKLRPGLPVIVMSAKNTIMTAITAAVVGVIASLAVVFAWHVWWPRANAAALFSGSVEWFAVCLSAAAGFALFRLKWGVMTVIGAGALIGAARALL